MQRACDQHEWLSGQDKSRQDAAGAESGNCGQEEADGTRTTAASVGPWRFGLISIVVGTQAGGKVDLHPKSKFWKYALGRHLLSEPAGKRFLPIMCPIKVCVNVE